MLRKPPQDERSQGAAASRRAILAALTPWNKLSYAVLAVIPLTLAAFGLSGSRWPVLFTPIAAVAWGYSTPLLLNVLNRSIESDRRATVLSVSSMLGQVLFIAMSPLFGLVSDSVSDRMAFAALAAMFVVAAAASWLLGLRARSRPPTSAPAARPSRSGR